ncbi:mitochondrial Rho GTPase 1 [Mangifera indica]|uniref:mitochondrial Rho GTPase 1 n=1 Tax=Mangifera indica TaxID=29780 RepID=UPI001CFA4417|nr:mitochondrial Rho GTPase 1 [Mangifera indica]
MAKASGTNASPGGSKARVRIVVCGGKGTGNSSLIETAAADMFPANVQPVLLPTRLTEEFYPDSVPITIIDTSSSAADRSKLSEEPKRADAVVQTYACDRPENIEELSGLCFQIYNKYLRCSGRLWHFLYAVHVNQPGGTRKILVFREIPEDEDVVGKLLSNKDSLAASDVAVFVHDSSDESSWKKATKLLVDVAGHGEATGYEVSCLIVTAKDDLDSFPTAIQDSTMVSQDVGIEAPIPISSKLGDFNNIFWRIVVAAEHPHLSIPETDAGRTQKHYHRLINHSLIFVSVGAAVAIVGLAAYRVYAARKHTSG